MELKAPSIVDLQAELAKLTIFRGRTPQSTMEDRKGSGGRLAPYRDGGLFTTKFAGKGHWELHLSGDELIHVVDGSTTLEMVGENGPQSFALRAGMLAVNPQGAWHRFHSADGVTLMTATPSPSEIIELDIDDPRQQKEAVQGRKPAIVDLDAELAKLTMFRRSPQSTAADRKGNVARLATYRDGLLLAIKASGKDHWERHLTGDELIHVLDGSATLEIVCDDGPPKSFALSAGMIAVIPQGRWHRFLSPEGNAHLAATPFPGETIELDVDDPRGVESKAI